MNEQINKSLLEINSDYEKGIEIYNDIVQRKENKNYFNDILKEFKPIFKEIFDNFKDLYKDTISGENYLFF